MPDINQESAKSLFLQARARGNNLSSATGFIVEDAGRPYLVTNWHVLSGLDSRTHKVLSEQTGAVPDAVGIAHNSMTGLGHSARVVEPLYDPSDPDDPNAHDRVPRWTGHPAGSEIDVAVLPLTNLNGVKLMPYELPGPDESDVHMDVTSDVSVVGFPFGLRHAEKLGIWSRGTVATEYEIDYDGRPCFLVDARTRRGQSGSPVLYFTQDARTVRFQDEMVFMPEKGSFSQLLGVYSGRVNDESDLGFVWRTRAIAEVLAAARQRNAIPG